MRCVLALVVVAATATAQPRSPDFDMHKFGSAEAAASGARCIDGTPAGYYHAKAKSVAQATQWVIYLQGGGFCNSTAPCSSNPNDISCSCRLNTTIGSSTGWQPDTVPTLDDDATSLKGIMSGNSTSNPGFAGANRVFVPYCDGSLWSGQQRKAVDGMYFAGHLTIAAVLHALLADGLDPLNPSTLVVLTGMSAGGVGTLINLDFTAALLQPARVVGMAGGGFFLFSQTLGRPGWSGFDNNWGTAADNLWGTSQTPAFVDETCDETPRYKCLEGPTAVKFITTPVLIAENRFDPAQLYFDGGDACPGTWDGFDTPKPDCSPRAIHYVEQFGINMTQQLKAVAGPHVGVFSPACLNHVAPFDALWDMQHSDDKHALRVSGQSLSDAFGAWLHNSSLRLIEDCLQPGPCNPNTDTCTTLCK